MSVEDKYSMGQAKAVGSTEKGLWIYIEDLAEKVFVPQSQIHDDSEVYAVGHDGELVVTAWFAEQRGWV